jgi:hypothetical protein
MSDPTSISEDAAQAQIAAVLTATEIVCGGNRTHMACALMGAIGQFAYSLKGGAEVLAVVISTLELAKAEIETGAPVLKSALTASITGRMQ